MSLTGFFRRNVSLTPDQLQILRNADDAKEQSQTETNQAKTRLRHIVATQEVLQQRADPLIDVLVGGANKP